MRKVERSDVVDFQTYNDGRVAFRQRVLEHKDRRRIHVGEYLTFLFETTQTVLYQVQEMMRLEHIVREKEILHELDTYNQLLGSSGELGCTLLIEIEDEAERDQKLRSWLSLPGALYVRVADGTKVRAKWDAAQIGDDRLSSVQYLKFDVGGRQPVAMGADHSHLEIEVELTAEQQATLGEDLQSDA